MPNLLHSKIKDLKTRANFWKLKTRKKKQAMLRLGSVKEHRRKLRRWKRKVLTLMMT